eukprot:CAMPEP_0173204548 /NCGR_PEP_ID=MMETSP1141-20130122/20183_1 /TAXON_ID=483371 /ORGANISM="non described non described, Strain CCMP2298" /LENGTH=132 /DNA_ID=CAMNT_0014130223 /DNA_START=300 /DNA_END=697 /DNA_ORIENTATION=+
MSISASGGGKRGRLDELDGVVSGHLARDPDEGLLEVVVHLGGDLVVLQVLLAVEGDLLGLHLAVLDLNLVAAQHDGDVLAHPRQVPVPVGHALVGDSRRHVEHNDGALALNTAGRKVWLETQICGGGAHQCM